MKYVIITHEHGDHFNGVRYLQDTYGVQAVSSDIAWQSMANGSPHPSAPRHHRRRWTDLDRRRHELHFHGNAGAHQRRAVDNSASL
jgi:phosphoribosyl 1,2-cyclic phosphodiesterase